MQKYQTRALKSLIPKIYVLVILSFILSGCNPTKQLESGEVYLKANQIKISDNIIAQDELLPYLKQRANQKAVWVIKLKMQQYLMFNDSVLAVKNDKKRIKTQRKNTKRIEAGKDTLEFKPVLTYRIKESGEAPVVFDETLAMETAEQFEKAIFNKGYFYNEVTPSFKYNSDSSKVKVIYHTVEGSQFKLNKIALEINDPKLVAAVKEANKYSLLHSGDPFNTEKIEKERLRFTTELRSQGYYNFSKENLSYEIDSTLSGDLVNIKIIISNPTEYVASEDTIKSLSHIQYHIGEIMLNTSFNPQFNDDPTDSIHFENITFINLSRLRYNPYSFKNKLFFEEGDLYSQKTEARTYTRLSGLNNFKYINISFLPDAIDSNILNCNIAMTPFPSQTWGVEVEGTNTSGNLGISGYLSYLHRNTFHNAEEFKVRFKGGLEAQPTNTSSDGETTAVLDIFNTVEYGVETSLTFQDLILPSGLRARILRKYNRPKTSVNFILNYQNRIDFERFLTNASLGYSFIHKKTNTNEFFIYPVDVSFIKIEKSAAFEQRLEELNNPLLFATYDNQFIAGSRAIQTWTNKKTASQKSFSLNRFQFELAGNVLSLANKVLNTDQFIDTTTNETYHTVGAIRYAQFLKVQNDIHYNSGISRGHTIAYRALGGIGIPYGNSVVIPYDRSFYGGGANDMRGWQARSLGPGGQLDDSLRVGIDQVADIKIQLGAEYRFNLFKALEGAVFADAGNIWLLKKDEARKLAEFDINRFYKEIALSAGFGARFNFGFLLVRLDWGIKIFDPALPEGQRFALVKGEFLHNYETYTKGRAYQYSVFNLGIGYPF